MAGEVTASGPLFNGRAASAASAYCHTTEMALAEEAAVRIRAYLPTQYKYLGHSGGNQQDNPVPPDAGHYEASIHAEAVPEGARVTDDEVIYGPWLEGTSSRNEATRFPGYGAFRQISQQVDAEAKPQAEAILPPYLAAMNGV
jgi:hypothetical protein